VVWTMCEALDCPKHYLPETLIDPLAYIRSHGGIVRLAEGQVVVTFDHATRERREICHRVARRYDALLKLQLDVPPGEKPRTVQQLVAAGKVEVTGGRYRVSRREGVKGSARLGRILRSGKSTRGCTDPVLKEAVRDCFLFADGQ